MFELLEPYMHLLFLMMLTPLAFPAAKLIMKARERLYAWLEFRKLIAIARDVGVNAMDLLKAENDSERLLLVQAEIAQELNLLAWRLIRLIDRAKSEGMSEAAASFTLRAMGSYRIIGWRSGVFLPTNWVANCMELYQRYPDEIDTIRKRTSQLAGQWSWCDGWLWQARKAESITRGAEFPTEDPQ